MKLIRAILTLVCILGISQSTYAAWHILAAVNTYSNDLSGLVISDESMTQKECQSAGKEFFSTQTSENTYAIIVGCIELETNKIDIIGATGFENVKIKEVK